MEQISPKQPDQQKDAFALHDFFPYLVRLFYREITGSVSSIYGREFGLSVFEWRIMAVLGRSKVMSAGEIVEYSSMTKVNVSRGIKGLQNSGLLKRDINGEDKRRVALRLTDQGVEVLNTLTPLLLELESNLLQGLDQAEIDAFTNTMEIIRRNAEKSMQKAAKS